MGRRPRREINIGQIYGEFLVIDDCGVNRSNHHYYKCKCTRCNKETKVLISKLNNGYPECNNCTRITDFAGQTVGTFEVLALTDKVGPGRCKVWLCKCINCGNTKEYASNTLTAKHVSCSCQRTRITKEESNKYAEKLKRIKSNPFSMLL